MNKKKILIIMCNSDPANPEECYTPIFQATVAAALSHEVEVVFTGVSGKLVVGNTAVETEVDLQTHRTLYDIIKEAHAAGVIFKACNTSLEMAGKEILEEVDEKVGAAYVIDEAMDDNTITFTY